MGLSAGEAIGRRSMLRVAAGGVGAAIAGPAAMAATDPAGDSGDDWQAVVRRLLGREGVLSSRVHLQMPPTFGNGYTVPLALDIDSPMTDADRVLRAHVIAPRNPIVLVATFRFTPASGRARIATRVRLSEPQGVLAVAEMSDGALLVAKTWVTVETDGCA